jgi:hypothetical protein
MPKGEMVSLIAAGLGVAILLIVLGDAFETIVLPRRVTRRLSLARYFYRVTWFFWSRGVGAAFPQKRRENYLSFYGPLSLVLLLIFWATGLIFSFGLLLWSSGSPIKTPEGNVTFTSYLYLSGTSFFTLGLGDVTPIGGLAKTLVAFEAGMGFGFLALVIGYLPVLNQSFSRRETSISLLDARAGSPPTALEMLLRHTHDHGMEDLCQLLHDWERWSAELLESHLSYPVLAFFRSHHDNESWIGALTAILDTSALIVCGFEGPCKRQAELTFAITRHAVVDIAHILQCPPREQKPDRLPPERLDELKRALTDCGMPLQNEQGFEQRLSFLRKTYEPYLHSLSVFFRLPVPPWVPGPGWKDNWQTSAWGQGFTFRIDHPSDPPRKGHF